MSKLPEPPYSIPLSEGDLVTLGRITAVFAQIDEFMSWVICSVHSITPGQLQTFLKDKMLSNRVDVLKEGIPRIKSPAAAKLVEKFVEQMKAIIPDRNLIVHGCWGQYTKDCKTFRVGPFSRSRPKQRFYVEQLPRLYKQSCAAARTLAAAVEALGLMMKPDDDDSVPIIWSTSGKPPEEGFWPKGSVLFPVPDPTRG